MRVLISLLSSLGLLGSLYCTAGIYPMAASSRRGSLLPLLEEASIGISPVRLRQEGWQGIGTPQNAAMLSHLGCPENV